MTAHERDHYRRCHCEQCAAHRAETTRRYRQANRERIYARQKARRIRLRGWA